MNSPRTKLYRDKRNNKFLGVCAGIADYTGVNALWVRLIMFVSIFTPGINVLTVPAYVLMGAFLNKKPDHLYTAPAETEYWQRVRQSPTRTAREIRAQMKDIDRRLADVETFYVSANPRLSNEIEQLR